MTDTTVDLYQKLSPEHRRHLDLLGPRFARFSGLTMMAKDAPKDPPDDPDDDTDDVVELEPDELILVGGKKLKVSDLQRIGAREKREGKKAGAAALLKRLGFETQEDLEDALAGVTPPGSKSDDDPDDKSKGKTPDDEATRRALRAQQDAARKSAEADVKIRRADLRGALRDAGVSRDDLDDAFAMLDRAVDEEYDDDELEEAVEALQERRPALFGDDTDSTKTTTTTTRPKATIPVGRPKRRNSGKDPEPGAEGRRRAEARGWLKSDA